MTFGLIGYPLSHSFSKRYFSQKFVQLEWQDSYQYLNFELENIEAFLSLPQVYPDLQGCNVTIPYKEAIMPFLDELSAEAAEIGAVNTVVFRGDKRIGYNTDAIGFRQEILSLLAGTRPSQALILGTGGASKAVKWVLEDLGIQVTYASRRAGEGRLTYEEMSTADIEAHQLIVNTTPLGMSPNSSSAPDLRYQAMGENHFCYDLIYNPAETRFLQLAAEQGAATRNGLGMLHAQAEAAWTIWMDEKEGRASSQN